MFHEPFRPNGSATVRSKIYDRDYRFGDITVWFDRRQRKGVSGDRIKWGYSIRTRSDNVLKLQQVVDSVVRFGIVRNPGGSLVVAEKNGEGSRAVACDDVETIIADKKDFPGIHTQPGGGQKYAGRVRFGRSLRPCQDDPKIPDGDALESSQSQRNRVRSVTREQAEGDSDMFKPLKKLQSARIGPGAASCFEFHGFKDSKGPVSVFRI